MLLLRRTLVRLKIYGDGKNRGVVYAVFQLLCHTYNNLNHPQPLYK